MDNFKKYLQEHRDELDVELPDEEIWQRVLVHTQPPKRNGRMRTLLISVAAAACVLAVILLVPRPETKELPSNTQLAEKTPGKEEKILPETTGQAHDTLKQKMRELPEKVIKETSKLHTRNTSQEEQTAIVNTLENNYAELVKLQLNNIRKTPVFMEGPEYFSDFKLQLSQMDADEISLRKDIKTSGLNTILLQQLINIYQQKLNLLKDLLIEINKVNNRVKQRSLPSDTLKTSYIQI